MSRSAVLFALVGVSCGALDPAPVAPAPVGDGIAPWSAPAPLELCLGGARLVAPSRDPGASGFCVNAPAVNCASDAACGARERCVCGRCALALCRTDGDCGAGAVCVPEEHRCAAACVASADCGASGACRAGACATRCERRADCARGELCDALGRCVAQPCRADGECGGDACDRQLQTAVLEHPSVVLDGARAVMFVASRGEGIVRAVSSDGVRWRAEPEAAVIAGAVGAPSAARVAGRWVLALEATDSHTIAVARSVDGVRFDAPVPLLRAEEAWEAGAVGAPSIATEDAGLWLAYGAASSVGLARVVEGENGALVATRVRDQASGTARVLDASRVTDAVLWRAVDAVESPSLLWVNEASGRRVLRVYFSARGAESSATATGGRLIDPVIHRSVGVAARTDGGGFEVSAFNPVLARGSGLSVVADARDPAVFSLAGRWFMALRGTELAGGEEGLFLAQGR